MKRFTIRDAFWVDGKADGREPLAFGPVVIGAAKAAHRPPRRPRTDILETDAAYLLTAELPGLSREDIFIETRGSRLTIRAGGPNPAEKNGVYRVRERRRGGFERDFLMPGDVDAEGISATMDKGLLRLTLPKTALGRNGNGNR